jgi:hypothetical protein
MKLRNACTQRTLAWIALFAIALVSIVPSVQQLLAVHAMRAGSAIAMDVAHDGHAMGAMQHGVGVDDPCSHGSPDGDPWHKCGYCDFLAHAPVLASVPLVALLATPLPPVSLVAPPARPVDATRHLVAQPRGPPIA